VTAAAAAFPFAGKSIEPWGGPNGGDGGKGGDVILLGDVNTNNLVDYKYQPRWRADRGRPRRGQGLQRS
jgi:GTP-binding protein